MHADTAMEHWQTILGMIVAALCAIGMFLSALRARAERKEKDRKAGVLRAIFRNSTIGITITCAGGPIMKVNPAFCEMLGYTEDEIRELGWNRLSHPEDHEEAKAVVTNLQSDETPDTGTFYCRYRKSDGSWLPAFVCVTHIPNGGLADGAIQVAQIQCMDTIRSTWKRTSKEKRHELDVTSTVQMSP